MNWNEFGIRENKRLLFRDAFGLCEKKTITISRDALGIFRFFCPNGRPTDDIRKKTRLPSKFNRGKKILVFISVGVFHEWITFCEFLRRRTRDVPVVRTDPSRFRGARGRHGRSVRSPPVEDTGRSASRAPPTRQTRFSFRFESRTYLYLVNGTHSFWNPSKSSACSDMDASMSRYDPKSPSLYS